jgi:hypothetical protein
VVWKWNELLQHDVVNIAKLYAISLCNITVKSLDELTMLLQLSRASAAALSTVSRTTTLSYGNMRFSGTCPAETPQLIKMKFCTIYYVARLCNVPKTVGIGWLEAAPQIGEI